MSAYSTPPYSMLVETRTALRGSGPRVHVIAATMIALRPIERRSSCRRRPIFLVGTTCHDPLAQAVAAPSPHPTAHASERRPFRLELRETASVNMRDGDGREIDFV